MEQKVKRSTVIVWKIIEGRGFEWKLIVKIAISWIVLSLN